MLYKTTTTSHRLHSICLHSFVSAHDEISDIMAMDAAEQNFFSDDDMTEVDRDMSKVHLATPERFKTKSFPVAASNFNSKLTS